jgi:hypothetical protein
MTLKKPWAGVCRCYVGSFDRRDYAQDSNDPRPQHCALCIIFYTHRVVLYTLDATSTIGVSGANSYSSGVYPLRLGLATSVAATD